MSVLDGAVVRPFGEAALVLEYGDAVDPAIHRRVLAADRALTTARLDGVEEVVPTYRSLLVRIDPLATTPDEVVAALGAVAPVPAEDRAGRHEVAVDFGAGEDLGHVAERTGLAPEAVVERLCASDLRVYLHGFAPGFAYLGGLPDVLHVPRRSSPRPPVEPGSVLLAAGQAALCPVPMPTGWWVVGRTDMVLFDPDAVPPVPFGAGDVVRLVAA